MTPRKDKGIGMMTLAELMGGTAEPVPAEIEKARAKVHQGARQQAMVQQRTVKPETFPVGNRAARRLAGSKKAEKPL